MSVKRSLREALCNNRGSAMVESAIYFPMIILATMFAIYMMINMYSESVFQAKMNMEVRAASMEKMGNASVLVLNLDKGNMYQNAAEANQVNLSEGREDGHTCIYGSGSLNMKSGRLTGYRQKKITYSARAYCVDEKFWIFG